VVFEDGAQKLGDGENELGVADLLENVSVEPLGEKQDALLLARGAKQAAFAGIGTSGLRSVSSPYSTPGDKISCTIPTSTV
jgi:hypothetical protein